MAFYPSKIAKKRGSIAMTQALFLKALGLDEFGLSIRDIKFEVEREIIKVHVVGDALPEVPEGQESPEISIKYTLDWYGKNQ